MTSKLFFTIVGFIGSSIVSLLGGWGTGMVTLIIFMIADYITGLVVAGVFKTSSKTDSGGLSSKIGLKGLFKKGGILLFVIIAYRLDIMLNVEYIRNVVIIGFIANELVSLVENAGLMGIPLPAIIIKAIDILQKQSEEDE